jgi:dTDP-4-dehydrorhamnose reductase
MRILLLGKDGQLGRELQRSLAPLGNLTAWGRLECDLSQTESLYAKVVAAKPDVIVNAAAYTTVDKAESEVSLAHAINAAAPALLAQAALDMSSQLIHYSTDYVFNGSGTKPWVEDSPTAPLNVYGKTKLEGEQAITVSGCKHLIFRTSWVYAKEGGNFAKTMLRLASERDALSVIDDQIGAPTDAAWLADMTAAVLARGQTPLSARADISPTSQGQSNALASGLDCPYAIGEMSHSDKGVGCLGAGGDIQGIFHAASAGEVSWHGYASYLIARARQMGFPIKVSLEAIRAVASEAFPTPAQRPRNSRLDCSKLTRTFGIAPPPWQDGINKLLQHLKP